MAQPYSKATQKILDDLLAALDENGELGPSFLVELRAMVRSGTLDDRNRIRQAVANLEAAADEPRD